MSTDEKTLGQVAYEADEYAEPPTFADCNGRDQANYEAMAAAVERAVVERLARSTPPMTIDADHIAATWGAPAQQPAEGGPCECKVCGNRCDGHEVEHGRGCYVVDKDGGGSAPCDCVPAKPRGVLHLSPMTAAIATVTAAQQPAEAEREHAGWAAHRWANDYCIVCGVADPAHKLTGQRCPGSPAPPAAEPDEPTREEVAQLVRDVEASNDCTFSYKGTGSSLYRIARALLRRMDEEPRHGK